MRSVALSRHRGSHDTHLDGIGVWGWVGKGGLVVDDCPVGGWLAGAGWAGGLLGLLGRFLVVKESIGLFVGIGGSLVWITDAMMKERKQDGMCVGAELYTCSSPSPHP